MSRKIKALFLPFCVLFVSAGISIAAGNALLEFGIIEHNVMSGIGNNVVGKRAVAKIPRELFLSASPVDVGEFFAVKNLYDGKKYNWLTVDFSDGTGVFYNGHFFLCYGELAEDGTILYPIEFWAEFEKDRETQLYDLAVIRPVFDWPLSEIKGGSIHIERRSDGEREIGVLVFEDVGSWLEKERYCQKVGDLIKTAFENTGRVCVSFNDALSFKEIIPSMSF